MQHSVPYSNLVHVGDGKTVKAQLPEINTQSLHSY